MQKIIENKIKECRVKKYKEKIKHYNEKDLRLEYFKVKKNYLKDVILELLKENLLNSNISLNEIIKKYQDEEISGLDKTYSEMIKNNKEILDEVFIRKYLKKFRNKDIEDALICKLVEYKKDELSLLSDPRLIEKHDVEKDLVYKKMYEKESQLRMKNKGYIELSLKNMKPDKTFSLYDLVNENEDLDILEIYERGLKKDI